MVYQYNTPLQYNLSVITVMESEKNITISNIHCNHVSYVYSNYLYVYNDINILYEVLIWTPCCYDYDMQVCLYSYGEEIKWTNKTKIHNN